MILTIHSTGWRLESFLWFSRRWRCNTGFRNVPATHFHFPHLPERWPPPRPRRCPRRPSLGDRAWLAHFLPVLCLQARLSHLGGSLCLPSGGLHPPNSLSPLSTDICAPQVAFSLMAAGGRDWLPTHLDPQLPPRSCHPTQKHGAGGASPVSWAGTRLLGYGCPVSCQSEGREQRNDPCCRDADIAVLKLFFKDAWPWGNSFFLAC